MERDKDISQPENVSPGAESAESAVTKDERIEAIIQPLAEAQEHAVERAQSGIEQVARAGANAEQIVRETEVGAELTEGISDAVSEATERVQEVVSESGAEEGFWIRGSGGNLEFQKVSSPRGPRTPEQDAAIVDRRRELQQRISGVDKKLADVERETSDPFLGKKRAALMDRKAKAQSELDSILKYYPEVLGATDAQAIPASEQASTSRPARWREIADEILKPGANIRMDLESGKNFVEIEDGASGPSAAEAADASEAVIPDSKKPMDLEGARRAMVERGVEYEKKRRAGEDLGDEVGALREATETYREVRRSASRAASEEARRTNDYSKDFAKEEQEKLKEFRLSEEARAFDARGVSMPEAASTPGETVRVRRSGGAIEDDWGFVGIREDGLVVVVRTDPRSGKAIFGKIPQQEFEDLNPEFSEKMRTESRRTKLDDIVAAPDATRQGKQEDPEHLKTKMEIAAQRAGEEAYARFIRAARKAGHQLDSPDIIEAAQQTEREARAEAEKYSPEARAYQEALRASASGSTRGKEAIDPKVQEDVAMAAYEQAGREAYSRAYREARDKGEPRSDELTARADIAWEDAQEEFLHSDVPEAATLREMFRVKKGRKGLQFSVPLDQRIKEKVAHTVCDRVAQDAYNQVYAEARAKGEPESYELEDRAFKASEEARANFLKSDAPEAELLRNAEAARRTATVPERVLKTITAPFRWVKDRFSSKKEEAADESEKESRRARLTQGNNWEKWKKGDERIEKLEKTLGKKVGKTIFPGLSTKERLEKVEGLRKRREDLAASEAKWKKNPKNENAKHEYEESLEKYSKERAEYVGVDTHRFIAEQRRLIDAKLVAQLELRKGPPGKKIDAKTVRARVVNGLQWYQSLNPKKRFALRAALIGGASVVTGGLAALPLGMSAFAARQAIGFGVGGGMSHILEKARIRKQGFQKENWEELISEGKIDAEKLEEEMARLEATALLDGKRPASMEGYDELRKSYEGLIRKSVDVVKLRAKLVDAFKATALQSPGMLKDMKKSQRRRKLLSVAVGAIAGSGLGARLADAAHDATASQLAKIFDHEDALPEGVTPEEATKVFGPGVPAAPIEEAPAVEAPLGEVPKVDIPEIDIGNIADSTHAVVAEAAPDVFVPITTDVEYQRFVYDNLNFAAYAEVENMPMSDFLKVFSEKNLLNGTMDDAIKEYAASNGAVHPGLQKFLAGNYYQWSQQEAFERLATFAKKLNSFHPDSEEMKMSLRYFLKQNIK